MPIAFISAEAVENNQEYLVANKLGSTVPLFAEETIVTPEYIILLKR